MDASQTQLNGSSVSSQPKTVAASIMFSQFASLCDGIVARKEAARKRDLFKSFLESWRNNYRLVYPGNPQPPTETFFPVLRLLLPGEDHDRPTYGIKDQTLAKLLIDEIGLSKSGEDAQILVHWKVKKPRNAKNEDVSDFAGVAYVILHNRTNNEGEISVEEVNQLLDELAVSNAVGGDERKEKFKSVVHSFFSRMNASELKWLFRVILKDPKLGIGREPILDTFHSDARELYDVCNSLSKVCAQLHNPNVRMSEINVSLFTFTQPMLAGRWNPDQLRGILKTDSPLIAEIKYDGERVQLHKQGTKFTYFSRSGIDISKDLGARPNEGNLTRHIADCFRPDAQNFIIDGEICPYSLKENCIATKAESSKIKSLSGATGFQVSFVVFDCLLYNDQILTGKPLEARQKVLKTLFQEEEGRLHQAVRERVSTVDECYEFLNKAIDRNEEGIIIKDLTTVYKPNKRDAGWWKIKPEFATSLSDHLDVLVVGGYYGTGRRSGRSSHFLVAVAQPPEDPEAKPMKFLSLCKVGSGYTMSELEDMNATLDKHWMKWTPSSRPAFLQLAPGEKPDLWVEPKHSFIVRIAAAQLLDSESSASGCTLRFPRMKEARTDKLWFQCMTLPELLALKEETKGRLGARNVTDADFTGEDSQRKRQKVNNRAPALQVGAEFRPADLHDVHITANIFHGKEFCVTSDAPDHTKQDLEILVVENGGTCTQQPTAATFCVISQKKTARVTNIFQVNRIDVVLSSWLIRCVGAGSLLPWQPEDVLLATDSTTKMIKSAFDKYGDSYTAPITEADFERLVEEMSSQQIVNVDKMVLFEEEHLQDFPLLGLFRLCNVYIDKFLKIGDSTSGLQNEAYLALAEEYILAFGGKVSASLDDVSHVVLLSSGDICRLDEFKKFNRHRSENFHLVTDLWVLDSVEHKNLREERGYIARPLNSAGDVGVARSGKVDVFTGLFDF